MLTGRLELKGTLGTHLYIWKSCRFACKVMCVQSLCLGSSALQRNLVNCRYSPGKAGTPRFRSDLSHAYGMQSYSWSPLSRHTHAVPPQHRSTPTKCCSSFGSQQPKRVADVGVSDTAQEREVEEGMDRGCKRWVAEGGGSVMVFEQEQDVGYVDIPRRVAWERLSSPGRKRHALQVSPNMWGNCKHAVPATQPSYGI